MVFGAAAASTGAASLGAVGGASATAATTGGQLVGALASMTTGISTCLTSGILQSETPLHA